MQSRSAFNNSVIPGLALAVLAGVGLATQALHAQTDLPIEVRSLPVWPGTAGAIRQYPDSYVFRETSGQIVLCYPDPDDPTSRITSRFWLQNRVDPHLHVSIARTSEGAFAYRYTLENGPSARTAIWKWLIVGPPSRETSVTHTTWQAVNAYQSVSAPQTLLRSAGPGSYLGWMDAQGNSPIEPGHSESGFEVLSQLRPGIATAYVSGKEDPVKVSEDVPDSLVRQITQLERPEIMNKLSVTIGPRFDPMMPKGNIAQAFESDIRDLQERGMLSRTSSFLQRLERALEGVGTKDEVPINVGVKPSSGLEQEIYAAAQLALTARQ